MKLSCEIITIGAELLKGSVLNTNARFLGWELTDLGFDVRWQTACGDVIEAIGQALREAIGRSDLIILSGGLGPTPDDLTREALSQFFKVPLTFSSSQFSEIRKHYQRLDRHVPEMVRREAHFPANATPLINRYGIALGFTMVHKSRLVVVLPGVPVELEKMFRELVKPLLRRHFRKRLVPRPALVVKTIGLSEPQIMMRLGRDFFKDSFDFGIYPAAGEVSMRIQADLVAIIRRLRRKVDLRLGDSIYAFEDKSLAEVVGTILTRRRKTLAAAESCTGGLLASEVTKTAGASQYFKGGLTVYSNEVKKIFFEWSGEKHAVQDLLRKGAVSKEVAAALAEGIRKQLGTTYGIGITGIAGPVGGSRRKPVGLVYLSLASPEKVKVWKREFWGDRNQIQTKAMKKALEYLWREIR